MRENIKPRLLLIEDNEGDILLTTEALIEHEVTNNIAVVKDGWEAIQYLGKKGVYKDITFPDIILLDINLPKINGLEVLKAIKENEEIKHIPVIMLTTSNNENDVLQSYKNYANCFITKPVEITEYTNAILYIQKFWFNIAQLPYKK